MCVPITSSNNNQETTNTIHVELIGGEVVSLHRVLCQSACADECYVIRGLKRGNSGNHITVPVPLRYNVLNKIVQQDS